MQILESTPGKFLPTALSVCVKRSRERRHKRRPPTGINCDAVRVGRSARAIVFNNDEVVPNAGRGTMSFVTQYIPLRASTRAIPLWESYADRLLAHWDRSEESHVGAVVSFHPDIRKSVGALGSEAN